MNRSITVHEVLRYTKLNAVDRLVHPYRNYWTVQRNPADPGARSLQLEAGINAPGGVTTPDGDRLPVLLLRSSPSKVGTMVTPWEDQYRLDEGRITYHGDHKVTSRVALGETRGNRRLLDVWAQHRSTSVVMRASAPPILAFRTATLQTPHGSRPKGFVEFCGLCGDRRPLRDRSDRPDDRPTIPQLRGRARGDLAGRSGQLRLALDRCSAHALAAHRRHLRACALCMVRVDRAGAYRAAENPALRAARSLV